MDTLGIWVGLNFLETVLFYYLLFGTVIDRKKFLWLAKESENLDDICTGACPLPDVDRSASDTGTEIPDAGADV